MNITQHNRNEAMVLMDSHGVWIEQTFDPDDYWWRAGTRYAQGDGPPAFGEWDRSIEGAVRSLGRLLGWKMNFKKRRNRK